MLSTRFGRANFLCSWDGRLPKADSVAMGSSNDPGRKNPRASKAKSRRRTSPSRGGACRPNGERHRWLVLQMTAYEAAETGPGGIS
jgi:hypothetical protein